MRKAPKNLVSDEDIEDLLETVTGMPSIIASEDKRFENLNAPWVIERIFASLAAITVEKWTGIKPIIVPYIRGLIRLKNLRDEIHQLSITLQIWVGSPPENCQINFSDHILESVIGRRLREDELFIISNDEFSKIELFSNEMVQNLSDSWGVYAPVKFQLQSVEIGAQIPDYWTDRVYHSWFSTRRIWDENDGFGSVTLKDIESRISVEGILVWIPQFVLEVHERCLVSPVPALDLIGFTKDRMKK